MSPFEGTPCASVDAVDERRVRTTSMLDRSLAFADDELGRPGVSDRRIGDGSTITMPPSSGFGNRQRRTAATVQLSTRALPIVERSSTDAMTCPVAAMVNLHHDPTEEVRLLR